MALIIKKELNTGLEIDNCYCNIANMSISKTNIEIDVMYFLNKEARFSNKQVIFRKTFSKYNIDNTIENINCFKYGYKILKELNEFKGAIDDLDLE